MNYLDLWCGRYWWCLEYKSIGARLSRYLRTRKGIIKVENFEGSLEECFQFLSLHGSPLDGVLVAEDSFPVRLVSSDEYSLLPTHGEDAVFLPGIPAGELKRVESITDDFVVLCRTSVFEAKIAELEQKGFIPLKVVPAVFLYASLLPLNKNCGGEFFVRTTESFSEIWTYANGIFLSYHKISAGIELLCRYFSEFYSNRSSLSQEYSVNLITESVAETETLSQALQRPVTNISLEQDILKQLAEDAWLMGLDKLPSLFSSENPQPRRRLREAAWFRKFLKIASIFTVVSLVMIAVLWLFVAGYSLYTRSDRLEFEKKLEMGRELTKMSRKVEQDRSQLEMLLKQRTRHASTIKELISVLDSGMWFSRIDIQGNRIALQGFALQDSDVSIYLSRLEKSPHLKRVRLRTTEKTSWKRRQVVRFDLIAEENP